MANLAVLKLNIAASQIGLTPRGFGDLLFAGTQAESSAFFGWSVSSIAALGDSMMSGSYGNGKITFLDTTVFSSLNDAVVRINASGECVLDTLPGGYSTTHLRLTGKGIIEQQVLVRNPSAITPGTVSSIVQPALPTQYALRQNYPNPFNPTTTISFALSKSSIVTITIYNVLGQVVKNLIDHQLMDGGDYAQQFNANNFSSGVYFYRITAQPVDANGRSQASSFTEVKKMVLMK